jgi:hypothetical protein
VVCLTFVCGGIWLGTKYDKPVPYLCAAFFALGLPAAVRHLLPGANYLTLKSDGFVVCECFRSEEIKWADVQGFTPRSIGHIDMVLFQHAPGFDKTSSGCVAKPIAGYDGHLPDRYGFEACELAAVMNRLRELNLELRSEQQTPGV